MRYSTPKQTSLVQYRSSNITEIIYNRIQFEDGEPMHGGNITSVSNRPPNYLHHHNALEIGYCYDGCGVFMIGPEVYNFGPGDVSIINAGVPHIARSSHAEGSNWAFLSIDPYKFTIPFSTDTAIQLCRPSCRGVLREQETQEISAITKDVFAELQACRECFRECSSGLLVALLCKISRLEPDHKNTHQTDSRAPLARISSALQMIAQSYPDEITVKEMAQACCMSEPQLRRYFLSIVGQSPIAYLTRFRLGMAISLLENSELSILQIANKIGYTSPSSFYRHFYSEFGSSPKNWRKKHDITK